jgi:GAF domain-containing protein
VKLTNDASLRASMNETTQPMSFMQAVADQTLGLISVADGVMIGLADELGVSYLWGAGLDAPHVGTRVNLDGSLSGLAIRRGMVLWSDDTEVDPRADRAVCRRNRVGSSVCVPLRAKRTLGVLAVSALRAHAFKYQDVVLVARLADFVSVAISLPRDPSRTNWQPLAIR